MIRQKYYVRCDWCEKIRVVFGTSRDNVTWLLRVDGWRSNEHEDVCSDCLGREDCCATDNDG